MSKKKNTDPMKSMDELLKRAAALAQKPFTPVRDPDLPSLRFVAASLDTTVIRTRKLLITAHYFSSPLASSVQQLRSEGKTVEEICQLVHLGPAAVYGYLPYEHLAYNLPQTTSNADRHKRYRATKKLKSAVERDDWAEALWHCVNVFEGYKFRILGLEGQEEKEFSYTVEGNDSIWIDSYDGEENGRRISRAMIETGFRKYLEMMKNERGVSDSDDFERLALKSSEADVSENMRNTYLLSIYRRFYGYRYQVS